VQDENVIIDNRFSVRLIDFGSAVVFQPGQLFATFYGTVEYCAPEVLRGAATLVMLLKFKKIYCQYCGSRMFIPDPDF
jgi:serine/threonine protein kinase